MCVYLLLSLLLSFLLSSLVSSLLPLFSLLDLVDCFLESLLRVALPGCAFHRSDAVLCGGGPAGAGEGTHVEGAGGVSDGDAGQGGGHHHHRGTNASPGGSRAPVRAPFPPTPQAELQSVNVLIFVSSSNCGREHLFRDEACFRKSGVPALFRSLAMLAERSIQIAL